jgi:hypothetical protein
MFPVLGSIVLRQDLPEARLVLAQEGLPYLPTTCKGCRVIDLAF